MSSGVEVLAPRSPLVAGPVAAHGVAVCCCSLSPSRASVSDFCCCCQQRFERASCRVMPLPRPPKVTSRFSGQLVSNLNYTHSIPFATEGATLTGMGCHHSHSPGE